MASESEPRVRPGPVRWLRYAYGAGLPSRYRTWVLHDVTAPTWVLRHVARGIAQLLPVAVVLYLALPIERGILLTGIVMGMVVGLLGSAAFVDSAADHRAMKAGYPTGHAEEVRRRLRGAR